MNRCLCFGLYFLFAVSQPTFAEENPQDFFKRYAFLGYEFDINRTSLYSDNATIHSYHVYPYGLRRTMELTGTQWKALIVHGREQAIQERDRSTFSDIKISRTSSSRFKIRASRFSEKQCYLDTNYYMIIEKNNISSFYIIEEYFETLPQSNCPPP